MNYCEGHTGLLKYDTIEDCFSFMVVKFILSAISDTWDLDMGVKIPFLKQYILSLSAISKCFIQSYFFLFFFSFTLFHQFLVIIRLIGFIIPNFCKKPLIFYEML